MKEVIDVVVQNGLGVSSFIALIWFMNTSLKNMSNTMQDISKTLVQIENRLTDLNSRVDEIEKRKEV